MGTPFVLYLEVEAVYVVVGKGRPEGLPDLGP